MGKKLLQEVVAGEAVRFGELERILTLSLQHGDVRDTHCSAIYPTLFPHDYTYSCTEPTCLPECTILFVALLPLSIFCFLYLYKFSLACLFLSICDSFLESELKRQRSEAFPRTYCQTKLICITSTLQANYASILLGHITMIVFLFVII